MRTSHSDLGPLGARTVAIVGAALATLLAPASFTAPAYPDLARQLFDTMLRLPGNAPGFRLIHAKGIVCQGTFVPTAEAATLSRAEHFRAAVPVVVRLSDAPPDPAVADASPDAAPRGMAIRFKLPRGETDIISSAHNGFFAGTGQEALAFQRAGWRPHEASSLARGDVPSRSPPRLAVREGHKITTDARQLCDRGVLR